MASKFDSPASTEIEVEIVVHATQLLAFLPDIQSGSKGGKMCRVQQNCGHFHFLGQSR